MPETALLTPEEPDKAQEPCAEEAESGFSPLGKPSIREQLKRLRAEAFWEKRG